MMRLTLIHYALMTRNIFVSVDFHNLPKHATAALSKAQLSVYMELNNLGTCQRVFHEVATKMKIVIYVWTDE